MILNIQQNELYTFLSPNKSWAELSKCISCKCFTEARNSVTLKKWQIDSLAHKWANFETVQSANQSIAH